MQIKKYIFWSVVVAGLLFLSCNRKPKDTLPQPKKSEVKEIQKQLQVKIKRFEQALYNIHQDSLAGGLQQLQTEYHCFLGDEPTSPENLQQIRNYLEDKVVKQLYEESQKVFPDLTEIERQFAEAFSLLLYYFPDAAIPRIYTAISKLDYEEPIKYQAYDSILVISLDLFLGKNYKMYKGLEAECPQYKKRRFAPEYILPSSLDKISDRYISIKPLQGNLLDAMIEEGKHLLFLEMLLPNLPDSLIFPFPQTKIEWVKANEASIWGDMIQKNYLYSRDKKVSQKLVGDAGFTTYYGNNSPGRVGAWMGWQICRSWVEKNPQRKITELFAQTDAQKILTESKYKP